ncbi:MAG: leucine-rich repeat domain-containing protein, partial [Prevotella sp.]|nr:leucine-rich repeat domain-containing protein [Prevotella sp.]
IPNSVTTIGNETFKYCEALTSINIPNSVTTIGYSAFSSCIRLKSINIPNSVTTIDDFAFSYCYKLKQVDIPNSVTTLCEGLLKSCSSLESIRIHKDVVEIEESVFDGCTKLTNISCEATTPPTCGTDAFKSVDKSNCKLFVPQASVDAYKIANEWKDFSYIEAATGITNNVYNKTELVDVYTIDGTKRLSKASKEEMNTLPKGVYIVNGKKLVIK